MDPPAGRRSGHKPVDVLGQDQCRQDLSYSVGQIMSQEPGIVFFDQSAQSPMAN